MHFFTILPAIAVALGAANAAAVDDSLVEPRVPREIKLLKLHGVPPGGVFTGVGIPGRCKNLPPNIYDFDRAEATSGFRCEIYTKKRCKGDTLEVPGGSKRPLRPDPDPKWRSWKCTWE